MITFTATLSKYDKNGEKSGWTFIEISAQQAGKINPGVKVGYRIKGSIDQYAFEKVAIMPVGEGRFIMPINAIMRKALGKKRGDKVKVQMALDERKIPLSSDLMKCLKGEPIALTFFKGLPKSHQNWFSKWVESAKTMQTKTKRITQILIACSKEQGFSEMMRENRQTLE